VPAVLQLDDPVAGGGAGDQVESVGIGGRRRTAGCTVYDCFGAGQHVTVLLDGVTWRDDPGMFDIFAVMRQVHELLWYLTAALSLSDDPALRSLLDETASLSEGSAASLLAADVAAHRARVNALLLRTSEGSAADEAWTGAGPIWSGRICGGPICAARTSVARC
jgi:hypothetical protein